METSKEKSRETGDQRDTIWWARIMFLSEG
jgi:hypothetical protein